MEIPASTTGVDGRGQSSASFDLSDGRAVGKAVDGSNFSSETGFVAIRTRPEDFA